MRRIATILSALLLFSLSLPAQRGRYATFLRAVGLYSEEHFAEAEAIFESLYKADDSDDAVWPVRNCLQRYRKGREIPLRSRCHRQPEPVVPPVTGFRLQRWRQDAAGGRAVRKTHQNQPRPLRQCLYLHPLRRPQCQQDAGFPCPRLLPPGA